MSDTQITIGYGLIIRTVVVHWRALVIVNLVLILALAVGVLNMSPWYSSEALITPENDNRYQMGAMSFSPIANMRFGGLLGGGNQSSARLTEVLLGEPMMFRMLDRRFAAGVESTSIATITGVQSAAGSASRASELEKSLRWMRKKQVVRTSIIPESGSIRVAVRMPREPELAQAVLAGVLDDLEKLVLSQHRSSAGRVRLFLSQRVGEVESALHAAEEEYARFLAANVGWRQSPILAMAEARHEREIARMQVIYTELMKQLELTKLEELSNAPVFTVVSPPSLKSIRVWPNRSLTMVLGTIAIAAASLLVLFVVAFWKRNREFLAKLLIDEA